MPAIARRPHAWSTSRERPAIATETQARLNAAALDLLKALGIDPVDRVYSLELKFTADTVAILHVGYVIDALDGLDKVITRHRLTLDPPAEQPEPFRPTFEECDFAPTYSRPALTVDDVRSLREHVNSANWRSLYFGDWPASSDRVERVIRDDMARRLEAGLDKASRSGDLYSGDGSNSCPCDEDPLRPCPIC